MNTVLVQRSRASARRKKSDPQPVSSTEIWSRVVASEKGNLPITAARFFVNLDFDDSDRDRVRELNQRANDGRLSSQEREELQEYIRVGDVISLLQSKARQALRKHGQKA